jgi:alkylation response protein AidB-like acyl-CoA dehydrogenase
MGATLNEQIIMTEELARIGAPHLPAQGLNHIGPILMEFGTAEQKARHLPPIIAGSVIWAQGYSEPGAGSDLANLSTRATLEGDRFVVQGQKIWTTWGHHSDWMFTLVRTDPQRNRAMPASAFCSSTCVAPASGSGRSRRLRATTSSARSFSTA